MTNATSPDLTKPKPTEVTPPPGRIQVETPEGAHQQMVKNVVTQAQQIEPGFTVEQAHPQSADANLRQNPHMQAVGAIVKDENGLPFTGNDVGYAIESKIQEAKGEPSKSRIIRNLALVKEWAKRKFGKKNVGPAEVIKVGE